MFDITLVLYRCNVFGLCKILENSIKRLRLKLSLLNIFNRAWQRFGFKRNPHLINHIFPTSTRNIFTLNKISTKLNGFFYNLVLAVTASGPRESSWACYCEEAKYGTCLGDVFSVTWMETIDAVLYNRIKN